MLIDNVIPNSKESLFIQAFDKPKLFYGVIEASLYWDLANIINHKQDLFPLSLENCVEKIDIKISAQLCSLKHAAGIISEDQNKLNSSIFEVWPS
jgi:hypothetical protein